MVSAHKLNVLQFKPGIVQGDIAITRSFFDLIISIVGSADKVIVQSFFVNGDPANAYNPIQLLKFSDGNSWDLNQIVANIKIIGTDVSEILYGDEIANTINGLGGNDTLYGYSGVSANLTTGFYNG